MARDFVANNQVITVGVLDQRPSVAAIFEGAVAATISPLVADSDTTTGAEAKAAIVADSFPDEDAEAAAVAREIRKAVAAGEASASGKLHKIAVASADPAGVERLVRVLERAGISVSAAATTRTADLPLVRAFLELAAIDPHQFPRRQVAALLATGKTKGLPSLREFDQLTRRTFMVNAGEDWQGAENGAAEAVTAAAPSQAEMAERDREALAKLLGLRKKLHYVWDAESWEELAGRMTRIVKSYLVEDEHAPLIHSAIAELGSLGEGPAEGLSEGPGQGSTSQTVGAPRHHAAFDVLAEALGGTVGEPSSGHVVVGGLETLVGRNLDHAFVTGLTAAALPGTFTQNAAISSAQSGLTSENYTAYRETLWAEVLRCARTLHCSYPRTSIAGQPPMDASQWLVRELSSADAIIRRDDLLADLLDDAVPLDAEEEKVLRGLRGEHPDRLFADVMQQREAGEASDFNGFVHADEMRQLAAQFFERTTSASAIESYVRSPLDFFIERLLRSWVLEDREASSTIDPRERGNVYHHIFEAWTNRVWLHAQQRPTSAGEVDWEWARTVLDEEIDRELGAQAEGQYSAFTTRARDNQVREVCSLWFEQQRLDALDGWIPLGAELSFGLDNAEPLEIPLESGRTLRFAGSIDRVDFRRQAGANGEVEIRVTDYKSGKSERFKEIAQEAPLGLTETAQSDPDKQLKQRMHIQLALYGAAILGKVSGSQQGLFGANPGGKMLENIAAEGASIHARYTFPLEAKPGEQGDAPTEVAYGVNYNEAVETELKATLARIVDLIEGGNFPVYPFSDGYSGYTPEQFVRLGSGNYQSFARELVKNGAAPLSVYSGAAEATGDSTDKSGKA
nr:PD-(D/E)XK nuclease family protein [Corynebacterium lactis]